MDYSIFEAAALLAIFSFIITFSVNMKKPPEKKRIKIDKDPR